MHYSFHINKNNIDIIIFHFYDILVIFVLVEKDMLYTFK